MLNIRPATVSDLDAITEIYNEAIRTTTATFDLEPRTRAGRQRKQAIIDEARRLGFHTLIAGVAERSDASRHLNLSFGFELVGTFREVGCKFGRLLDVTYLQLMLK